MHHSIEQTQIYKFMLRLQGHTCFSKLDEVEDSLIYNRKRMTKKDPNRGFSQEKQVSTRDYLPQLSQGDISSNTSGKLSPPTELMQ